MAHGVLVLVLVLVLAHTAHARLAAGCWLLAAGCWLPRRGWQGRAPMVTATERQQTIFIFYDINRAWSPSRYQFES